MYSIRVRINHRVYEYCHHDKANVGVRLKSGRIKYMYWRGFTLEVIHPVKLVVEAFTIEDAWNPRDLNSKMPNWEEIKEGEYLLGNYSRGFVYTVLPFRIV